MLVWSVCTVWNADLKYFFEIVFVARGISTLTSSDIGGEGGWGSTILDKVRVSDAHQSTPKETLSAAHYFIPC